MTLQTLFLLAIFAVAMGLLEAAVVVYMRRLYYPTDPLSMFPMQFLDRYDALVELSREVATIVMLVTVALLVERASRTRSFAAFVFVFGVWDLFYYVWLKVLIDWPRSWLEWDVLFLIPMVWLGPWICPALISLLFIVWGSWTLRSPKPIAFSTVSFSVFTIGAALGLIAFFQPALGVLAEGDVEDLKQYVPGQFWWWLFALSYWLMTWGLGLTLGLTKDSLKLKKAQAS
ncbi:MAG: hypothetical protein SFV81_18235 [Pirellulaceae bacterium]|nr:hypothetical protein [Pirellulaceae bacterium]